MPGPMLRLDEVADVAEDAAHRRAEAMDDAKARLVMPLPRAAGLRPIVDPHPQKNRWRTVTVSPGRIGSLRLSCLVTSAPWMLRVTCTQLRLARGVKPPATAIADWTVSPAT